MEWAGAGGVVDAAQTDPDIDRGDRDLPSIHHSACTHHLESPVAIVSMFVYGNNGKILLLFMELFLFLFVYNSRGCRSLPHLSPAREAVEVETQSQ